MGAKKEKAKKLGDSSDDEQNKRHKGNARGKCMSENPVLDKAVDLHLDNTQDSTKDEVFFALSLAGKECSKCSQCNKNIAENRWRVARQKKCAGSANRVISGWWHSACFLKVYS